MSHNAQCGWHCDQYDWECDCGELRPQTPMNRQAMILDAERRRDEAIAEVIALRQTPLRRK